MCCSNIVNPPLATLYQQTRALLPRSWIFWWKSRARCGDMGGETLSALTRCSTWSNHSGGRNNVKQSVTASIHTYTPTPPPSPGASGSRTAARAKSCGRRTSSSVAATRTATRAASRAASRAATCAATSTATSAVTRAVTCDLKRAATHIAGRAKSSGRQVSGEDAATCEENRNLQNTLLHTPAAWAKQALGMPLIRQLLPNSIFYTYRHIYIYMYIYMYRHSSDSATSARLHFLYIFAFVYIHMYM